MALFRRFVDKKPPDGLLVIADNIYVFDHCFSMKEIEEEHFEAHIEGIARDLLGKFHDHSFMISNFGNRKEESPIYHILSEYGMTVLDYPDGYEGCPLLTMEMIHCILKSSESWLSLGQHNLLLMHCEKGCWPLLAFILAALLVYLGHYSDEQKTLDMLYKQSSLELLEMFSPLNPMPSQMRYLRYISMKNIMSEWPPSDRALDLDCVILRMIPNFHGQGGFRPIIRIYGPDPDTPTDQTPKVLFSTPKKSNIVRFYSQDDELVKINLQCHVQGDVVLECINLCEDLDREEMVFRIMFNTAFIRSNILMLNRDHVDMLWNSEDQFPKDFRLEVIFSDMDAITSHITTEPIIHQEKQGLEIEAYAKVLDIFNHMDWLDGKKDIVPQTARPPPPPPPPPFSSGAKKCNTARSKSPRSLHANQSSKRTPLKPQEELDFDKFPEHIKSSTVIPKLQVPHRHSESRVLQILQELSLGENFISRMDDTLKELNTLERTFAGFEKPSNLKLSLLKIITDNFSDELKIGEGGCGKVYKGILRNGIIAVKRLFNSHTIDDRMFHQEVQSLTMAKHKNTVRFLGYCSHTEGKAIDLDGKIILAEIRERLLCFEYLGNGSLEDHITDELRGLEWQTRYQIIQGICEGLHHLHKEKGIIHMDLKPANILLDENMVPKITDFGLSRLDEKSQTLSENRFLSLRYCAPEYQIHGRMSAKSDIYSLGVIIRELVTGSREEPSTTKVLRRWKHRWNKSVKDKQSGYKEVAKCLDLAQRCMHTDPTYRPHIWNIIGDLQEMRSVDAHNSYTTECLELEDMLGIEPLDEMNLPFKLNRQLSCSIELTNDTGRYFAFRISTTSPWRYYIVPAKDIVPPRSKLTVNITLQATKNAPPQNQYKDEFTVQSTTVDGNLKTMDINGEMFDEKHGKVVDKVNFMIVLDAS